jgi:lipid-A-disaccharide synthase
MKYYIIAGEASGDLHGGRLVQAIRAQDPAAVIKAWGGDQMQAAGATLVKHYRELAFMGFIEVLKNSRTILRNIQFCKKEVLAFQPDVLVLIDYPGFNLTIAPWAKKQGLKVAYYISPQVWAWKEGRVKKMKQCIDQLMVILPFEKEYYQTKWNWTVDYVGHPLLEAIQNYPPTPLPLAPTSKSLIALLPGSRLQEIDKKLPIMLAVAQELPAYQFVVAKAPGVAAAYYQQWETMYPQVQFVEAQTYSLLQQATAALVTSGTATLETALFKVPQVVCYKGSALSYAIGKRVIKVKFISLVNLILNAPLVEELIQDQLTPVALANALEKIVMDGPARQRIIEGYNTLAQQLTQAQPASQKAAHIIVTLAKKST